MIKFGMTVYALIALVTFAYAAAVTPDTRTSYHGGYTVHHSSLDKALLGFWAGVAWPLYWSWTAAEIVLESAP